MSTKQSTREVILTSAMEAFSSLGYDATSVQEICKRAGVSNGSMFHFFPTKESIAASVHVMAVKAYQDGFIRILNAGSGSFETDVKKLVRYHLKWVENDPGLAHFLLNQGKVSSATSAHDLRELNRALIESFAVWIKAATGAEAVRPMPKEAMLACLVGPCQFVCRAWLSNQNNKSPTKYAKELADAAWLAVRQ